MPELANPDCRDSAMNSGNPPLMLVFFALGWVWLSIGALVLLVAEVLGHERVKPVDVVVGLSLGPVLLVTGLARVWLKARLSADAQEHPPVESDANEADPGGRSSGR